MLACRLALLAVLATCLWSGLDGVRLADDYRGSWDTPFGWPLLSLRAAAMVVSLGGLAFVARSANGLETLASQRGARLLREMVVHAPLVALVFASLFVAIASVPTDEGTHGAVPDSVLHFRSRSAFLAGLLAAQASLLGVALRRGEPSVRSRTARMDRLGTQLALALILLETGVSIWGRIAPTPVVFDGTAERWLEANRPPGGATHLGARLNSGGYLDDEFFASDPDDVVVAVLADSFGLGVVPREQNFVSVAEAELARRLSPPPGRVALHNFGVSGIGLAEHALLLSAEVEPIRPTLVVLCLFVGNDVTEGVPFGQVRTRRYALQDWLVWEATRRVLVWHLLPKSERDVLASAQTTPDAHPRSAGDAGEEAPTHSRERFLEIERRRLRVIDPEDARVRERFEAVLEGVDYFHRRLGERLLVVLIPDEFQVNDALFAELLPHANERTALRRDGPQERIRAHCERRGIECLDLLPDLREAEPGGRTYHLRDTHWNARGNRVAGQRLARELEELLRRPGDERASSSGG